MSTFLQDIRYGLRVMLKSPVFTAVAVIALAMGIGANSAIFSVVNAVLLRPLPYKDSNRLVWIWDAQQSDKTPAAFQEFDFWRSQNHSLDSTVAIYSSSYILTGNGEPERLKVQCVTKGFFANFGIVPALGRDFLPEEDLPHANHVVMLSDGLWKRRFGSDPAIVGQPLRLNGASYTVVGILPPDPGHMWDKVELFTPLAIDGSKVSKGTHFLNVMGKLKSGVSLAQAQSDLDVVADRYRHDNSTTHGISIVNLQEQIVGQSGQVIMVLFGAVAFVLLIACANVANLLLARAASREKEIALRIAIGANRWRIVRQLLTESILLSLIGGFFGIILAYSGLRLLVALGPDVIPRTKEISLDTKVILFTVAVSVITGTLFGLIPALRSSRQDLTESLKGTGRSTAAGFGGKGMRSALIVSEIALTLVLLI
ncbi:MAG TPA: ABC transporter permease, partial [Blastocatellia bacterium]|nr:ABC transporter permease [Blastocatellia bacterium]